MKVLAVILNIFLSPIGTFILGKVSQGLIQIVLIIVAAILCFTGIGFLIGIPIMFIVWIWGIIIAVSYEEEPTAMVLQDGYTNSTASTTRKDDEWDVLVKYNDKIKAAFAYVEPFGPKAINEFKNTIRLVKNDDKAMDIAVDVAAKWKLETMRMSSLLKIIGHLPVCMTHNGIEVRNGTINGATGFFFIANEKIHIVKDHFDVSTEIDNAMAIRGNG